MEASGADALNASGALHTLGASAAGGTFAAWYCAARSVRVATGAWVAHTFVGGGVGAMTVQAATRTAHWWRWQRWKAQHLRITNVVRWTFALVEQAITLSTFAALLVETAVQASVAQTDLSLLALLVVGAVGLSREASTTSPWVAIEAIHALANGSIATVDYALSVNTAKHACAR